MIIQKKILLTKSLYFDSSKSIKPVNIVSNQWFSDNLFGMVIDIPASTASPRQALRASSWRATTLAKKLFGGFVGVIYYWDTVLILEGDIFVLGTVRQY